MRRPNKANTAPPPSVVCAPFSSCNCMRFRSPRLHLSSRTRDAHLRWHRLSLDQSSMGREPYRIIVVEDHASTAEALRKFLTTIGYKVYIAPDVSSARALAKAIEFDVLLSDLRLPDGTGWDLMEELSATKPVRGIAISGHNTDTDIERSRKVGFLDHIAKPLVAEELTAAIERAVAKPRQAAARH